MEHLSLVCIDNIECIAGDEFGRWRFSISTIEFWNRAKHGFDHRRSSTAAVESGITGSRVRLDWGQIYKLQPLSDEDKLQRYSYARVCVVLNCRKMWGVFAEAARQRNAHVIYDAGSVGRASITAQRKLTIPFVKEILNCR